MAILVKIISVIITILGFVYLISPVTIKVWLKSCERGKRPALAVWINLILGVFLITSAGEYTIEWVPQFIGALAIVKGIILLIYGPKRLLMKASIWFGPRMHVLRFLGFVPILLGIMLFISV